ncbi:MAG: hypothetical protein QMC81_11480 [Thermoanaerobacterales bacterium]|nr:hypothetical protein [Thermoanaerobacterales bacterium]MDQ7791234.1 hypothetical protein [Clostridia bacterium]
MRRQIRQITVILTEHFQERYRERVGTAPASAQRAWVTRSLEVRRPKRQRDGKYRLKLVGSRHQAVLAREKDIWVAVTVK